MAASSSSSRSHLLVLVGSCLLLVSCVAVSEAYTSTPHQPLVNGLSWSFYKNSCPNVESIIRTHLKKVFKKDIGNAAALLRLHFHDCFVQVSSISILNCLRFLFDSYALSYDFNKLSRWNWNLRMPRMFKQRTFDPTDVSMWTPPFLLLHIQWVFFAMSIFSFLKLLNIFR